MLLLYHVVCSHASLMQDWIHQLFHKYQSRFEKWMVLNVNSLLINAYSNDSIRVIRKVTLCFTPYLLCFCPPIPPFQWYLKSKKFLLNLGMKCWNSACKAHGSRVIIVVVQVGAVKIWKTLKRPKEMNAVSTKVFAPFIFSQACFALVTSYNTACFALVTSHNMPSNWLRTPLYS
jgi:hypothetical protein